MLLSDNRTVYAIARDLNKRGVSYLNHAQWDYQAVYNILTHPKYCGCHVFGRTSRKLYTPTVNLPPSQWVLTPGAFEPIVDSATFEAAQKVLRDRTFHKSDEEVLDDLRSLLATHGRLTLELIQKTDGMPSPSTYRERFGSLRRAYELVGYGCSDRFELVDSRYRILTLRDQLFARINELFLSDVSTVRHSGRWRSRLRFSNGTIVSVLIGRALRVWKQAIRWQVEPHPHERRLVTLLVRLNASNTAFLDYHVLPRMEGRTRFRLRLEDPWLNKGRRLQDLSELRRVVEQIARPSLSQQPTKR
jgi:hypothetical protein